MLFVVVRPPPHTNKVRPWKHARFEFSQKRTRAGDIFGGSHSVPPANEKVTAGRHHLGCRDPQIRLPWNIQRFAAKLMFSSAESKACGICSISCYGLI